MTQTGNWKDLLFEPKPQHNLFESYGQVRLSDW